MTFEEAKMIQAKLNAEVDAFSAAYNSFPKGPMGLTPDEVKFSPAYRTAKAGYVIAFTALREHNAFMTKRFAKEMRQERRARRVQ